MKRIALALALAMVAAALTIAGTAGARTQATVVKVKASEFKFVLSTKSAKHGAVIFKVTNAGKLPHDFKIDGKKTVLIKPGKTATLTATVKSGKNAYLCTVAGHAAAGMKGVFTGK